MAQLVRAYALSLNYSGSRPGQAVIFFPNRRYDEENHSLNTNYFLQFKCKNIFFTFSVSAKFMVAVDIIVVS